MNSGQDLNWPHNADKPPGRSPPDTVLGPFLSSASGVLVPSRTPTISSASVVSTTTLPTSSPSPSQAITFSTPLPVLPSSIRPSPTLPGSSSFSAPTHKISSTTSTTRAGASASVATSSSSATIPSHHSPSGAVVGGIVASILITFIIGCLFCLWLRRRRRNNLEVEHTSVLPVFSETTEKCSPDRTSTHYLLDTRRLSQVSHLTPLRPGATPRLFAPQNTGYPVMEKSELLHEISSWEAKDLSRQNEILRRENEELWDDVENLQRVNEKIQLKDLELSK